MITLVLYIQILTMAIALSPHYKSVSEKTSSSESLETQNPTLNATWIAEYQTITLTCNIYGETARSVGWYRNQGRKVISIGYVDNRCETSPPELPFFARCLCLNITVFSCTLTVEMSMHNEDEWECSFADNGLSIKSNVIRIRGSNVSRNEAGMNKLKCKYIYSLVLRNLISLAYFQMGCMLTVSVLAQKRPQMFSLNAQNLP
ncbi:uncharacterized protein LOC128222522 [Mya arenaria]|uniref:uncharacterized protein LOC128222522 n=1 Tax=Mya arenaria TaxID=6604 RepID=UPI0022E5E5F1|nr:uncharacterized protein LOC128222522 [Mya arenaria]XP_052787527.1 uncharacterized protein LOC128222522 [Mya arenaria]